MGKWPEGTGGRAAESGKTRSGPRRIRRGFVPGSLSNAARVGPPLMLAERFAPLSRPTSFPRFPTFLGGETEQTFFLQ